MSKLRFLLVATGVLLAGCRTGGPAAEAPRVGPSLDKLDNVMRAPGFNQPQKDAYWASARGRLLRAVGTVLAVGDRVLLEVPPSKERSSVICVSASPDPSTPGILGSVRTGQKLGVLGELAGRNSRTVKGSSCDVTYELQNARFIVK